MAFLRPKNNIKGANKNYDGFKNLIDKRARNKMLAMWSKQTKKNGGGKK
ncbi:hypothetical protein [Paenibacillus aceti]|uniref:Uncharacterized protein n=1 Tax=Paenibacillus aceti TaxID=1820010 RepID=A0ABQ1W8Y2_9BACL|nr:hypothetical protein [Paenibacillus aceti]GGG19537.1 hypothetical protein GCM10010913_47020 [Paenibacillus aceti]